MKYEEQALLDAYRQKVQEHWYTMYRPILALLGKISSKTVLDIGCGSGDLTHELAKRCKQAIGIDASKKWIDYCQKNYSEKNLEFVRANGANLKFIKSNSIDTVVMNMVLLNVPRVADVRNIFKEIKRVLKKNGQLIFSDLHPLCVMAKKEGSREQRHSKDFSYNKIGGRFSALVTLPSGRKIEFVNSHWPISMYSELLYSNGLHIERIIESSYPSDAPKKYYRYSFPEYITFSCRKA